MALATTMLVTSFNVVYAQDADVATGETTVESSETSPSDATVSGVAVTNGEDAVATTSEDGNMVSLMAKLGQQLLHGKLQFR